MPETGDYRLITEKKPKKPKPVDWGCLPPSSENKCGPWTWTIALFTGFWCIGFCPVDERRCCA